MTALVAAQTVSLSCNGSRLSTPILSLLISCEVRQQVSLPAQMTATFLVPSDDDESLPEIGDTIDLEVDQQQTLFSGDIQGIEREWRQPGLATVTLRAYDALDSLRHVRTMVAFENMSRSEIMVEVAESHGLNVDDFTSDLDAVAVVLQYGESDLAFLRRLAKPIRARFRFFDDTLSMFDDDDFESPLELEIGRDLLRVGVDERSEDYVDEPTVIGWHESETGAVTSGSGPPSGGWLVTPADAAAVADSIERASQSDRVVVTGTAVGTAEITPGRQVEILDIEDPSEFVVVSATHTFTTADGYVTSFSSEPIDPDHRATAAAYTIGEVVDLDDPDHRGRIKVALLAYDSIETGWLPVVGPGVGVERGVMALPDIADRVIVLGPADDVGSGVVLGGIATGAELAGPPIEGGQNERIVARLPGGAAVVLENNGLCIEDGFGSSIEFREDQVTLHASTDLEIAAPGNTVVIRADQVDFEQS